MDRMHERRVRSPVDICDGPRREAWVKWRRLVDQRQSATALNHPLNVRRCRRQAGDLWRYSNLGQHFRQANVRFGMRFRIAEYLQSLRKF